MFFSKKAMPSLSSWASAAPGRTTNKATSGRLNLCMIFTRGTGVDGSIGAGNLSSERLLFSTIHPPMKRGVLLFELEMSAPSCSGSDRTPHESSQIALDSLPPLPGSLSREIFNKEQCMSEVIEQAVKSKYGSVAT